MENQPLQDQLETHLTFLAQDENNLSLLLKVTELYLDLNNLESAQIYLDKATAIDPQATLGHQGLINLNLRKIPEAQKNFEDALALVDTPTLRYNLGFIHFLQQELGKAWDVLEPILEGEHYPDAELLMARILHRQGSMEDAVELLAHLLEENSHNADALGLLALIYFDINQEEQAHQMSTAALVIDPDNYDARVVNILIRLMSQETTVEEIQELLNISPQDSRLWFALGNTYMALGDFELAEEALEKTIALYPEFYDSYISLGWCQLLNDELDDAQDTYQRAVVLAEDIADGWGGLALVSALKADFSTTDTLINKARHLEPESFLTQLAEAMYLDQKSPEQANPQLVKVLKDTKLLASEKLAFYIEALHADSMT